MLFLISRILLFGISALLFYCLIIVKFNPKPMLKKVLPFCLSTVILLLSIVFPVENVFQPFKTLESAYAYQNSGSLLFSLEGEQSALCVSEKELSFIPKDEKGYGVKTVGAFKQVEQRISDGLTYTVYHYKGTEDYYGLLSGFLPDAKSISIRDSKDSTFVEINSTMHPDGLDYIYYGAVLNGYTANDTITISMLDGTEVCL